MMRTGILNLILIIFISATVGSISYPQEHNLIYKDRTRDLDSQRQVIFSDIEDGIRQADVNKISKYFSQQPYLSFSNDVTGYYSANQAFYILEEFLNLHRVISFKFDNKKMDEKFAYATGTYQYELKGKRDTKQIYLTLNKIGKNWYITQISIN